MPVAVNICLPLPRAWAQEVSRLNALLPQQPNAVPLAAGRAVPHITLAMGTVGSDALADLAARLQQALATEWPTLLAPVDTYLRREPGGVDVSGVLIERSSSLQRLHERCMAVLTSLGLQPAVLEAIDADGEAVNPATLTLLQNFSQRGCYGGFFPHITLGLGALAEGDFFAEGPAELRYIAVYTLGNLCSCRKELFRMELGAIRPLATAPAQRPVGIN